MFVLRSLPRRFRPPRGLYGGLGFLSFFILTPVLLSVVLPIWSPVVTAVVVTLTLLVLGGLFARVSWMGTIITADGVTRRSFFVVQHWTWSDIVDVDLHVPPGVAMVGPFQVGPRGAVIVRARPHEKRKKLLLFFDDRAYRSDKDFERDLNEFVELWRLSSRGWR